jgi:hypothetical protein
VYYTRIVGGATIHMADDKTAVVQFKIREWEYLFLLRLRQLSNQAGEEGQYRLELELSKNTIQITNQQKITRESFTLLA